MYNFSVLLYLVFVILSSRVDFVAINPLILLNVSIFPTGMVLCRYFFKNYYSIERVLSFFINVGTIQGLIAVIAFVFPNIQRFFLDQLLQYGVGDVVNKIGSFRMYGYSLNLTFATPALQAFLAVLAFYLIISLNKRIYIFHLIILIMSGVLNARTSFVIFIVGMFFFILIGAGSKKMFIRNVFLFGLVIPVIGFLLLDVIQNSEQTSRWIGDGINEILSFFKGQRVGYFTYFDNATKFVLPKNHNVIFGKGVRIMFSNPFMVSSDIGYINDIWLGGILYAVSTYIFYIYFLIKGLHKRKGNLYKFLFWFSLVTLFILNIKGYIFSLNDITTCIWFILCFSLLCKENKNNEGFDISYSPRVQR